MNFKKILIYFIFAYLFYILYKKIINSQNIEHFKSDFMYYSNECKKKSKLDPNLHKYSINYIDNVYSAKNENNLSNEYYKSLGDALGNIDKIKNIDDIKEIENLNLSKASALAQNNSSSLNKKIPEYSTCKTPKKKIIVVKNKKVQIQDTIERYSEEEAKVSTIEFQKIISLDIDINTDNSLDTQNNDYYHEYSNNYFNDVFKTISSNNYKPLIDFTDQTNTMTETLYSKYLLIEDSTINLINNIKELRIENGAKFEVVQRYIKSYLYSETTDNSYIEFDILIYRAGKNNGKHINIIASLDKIQIELINVVVIGLVIESDINVSVIPYDIIKDEEMVIEDNNDEEYSLIKMSDLEINNYIAQHETQLLTRTEY